MNKCFCIARRFQIANLAVQAVVWKRVPGDLGRYSLRLNEMATKAWKQATRFDEVTDLIRAQGFEDLIEEIFEVYGAKGEKFVYKVRDILAGWGVK